MPGSVTASSLAEYTEIAGSGDHAGAVKFVEKLLDAGVSVPELLRSLLAPSQETVGLRWQHGEWTVAKEHTASAVTNTVLERLAGREPVEPKHPARLIVAMAESDWHSTGASIVSIGLRHAGFDVVEAPAGTSAGQLAALVHDVGPAAVVLTCSVPSLLPGARRLIVAAQDAGTPVVVGGRAFGEDDRRAMLIGANAWAGDVTMGAEMVLKHAGFSNPSHRFEHACTADYARLRQRLGRITEAIRHTLASSGASADDTLESALFLLRSLVASLLIDDATILDEDLQWSLSRRDHGGPPVMPAVTAIRSALSDDTPAAISMLEAAGGQLTSQAGGK